jgi:hypothetical protein
MQIAQLTLSRTAALAVAVLSGFVAAAGCVDSGTGQSGVVDSLTTDEGGVLASSQLYADGSVIGRLEAEDGTVLLTLELPAGETVADIRTQEQTIPFEVDVSQGLGPINRGMTFVAASVLGAADVPYGYSCRDWGYFINCADGCCWLMIYKDGSGTNGGCCSSGS